MCIVVLVKSNFVLQACLIYLLVSVIVLYAHVMQKTATLSEHLSDEKILSFIRATVGASSLAITVRLLHIVWQVEQTQYLLCSKFFILISLEQRHLQYEDAEHLG